MKKYLFLAAVLAATVGGTLSATVGAPVAEAVEADTLLALMTEETIVTASLLGEVTFAHRYHYEDEGIACDECHHETNAGALHLSRDHEAYFEDFWIDCAVCHRGEGEAVIEPRACSECHPDQERAAADETLSAKVAIHRRCEDCHDFGTGAEAFENCQYCHTGEKSGFDVGATAGGR